MPKKKKEKVTEERIIQELAKIAFNDIGNYISYGKNENGEVVISVTNSDETDTRAVAEVTNSKSGFKFKMYNKMTALLKLGDYLGMWKRQPEEEVEDFDELEVFGDGDNNDTV
ncbi:MAG: hypothetical protein E7481_03910 [Ruminococcaceae bacterium]|nr:hypothetical protein [Oscillospiraceae bacterium]MBQ2916549.1 terminase small subunit [Clostridia bacterium]